MSARGKFIDLEEKTRRVTAAVQANHISADLGAALIESAEIHFTLHHAGNCTNRGNLQEAVKTYQAATCKFEQFKGYLERAQLTPEQRQYILGSLEQGFYSASTSITKHHSYSALSQQLSQPRAYQEGES